MRIGHPSVRQSIGHPLVRPSVRQAVSQSTSTNHDDAQRLSIHRHPFPPTLGHGMDITHGTANHDQTPLCGYIRCLRVSISPWARLTSKLMYMHRA